MGRFIGLLGFGRARLLNIAVLFISFCLVLWTAVVWVRPMADLKKEPPTHVAKSRVAESKETKSKAVSYDIIVEKDIFRESRRRFMAKPASPPPVKAALPPAPPLKTPPPKLALIGTVVLEDGNAAIIDYGGKPAYYKVGESIEEFVIREIDMNNVLLERAGEPLKISITPAR